MSDELRLPESKLPAVAAIDAMLAFADRHCGEPLNPSTLLSPDQWSELGRLDAELYAQCSAHDLQLPEHENPNPQFWSLFGWCKLPYAGVEIHAHGDAGAGLQIYPTREWLQAIRSLRAAAVVRLSRKGSLEREQKVRSLPVEDLSGKPVSPNDSADQPRFTVEELILQLECSERAYEANMKSAEREKNEASAYMARLQAAALLFRPEPTTMPGIDRIEVLCDELGSGTGLTSTNVRQLRACLCRRLGCSLQDANRLSLEEAATALEALPPQQPESATPQPQPKLPFLCSIQSSSPPAGAASAKALWESDPVQAFERLRDSVCIALDYVGEAHRLASGTAEGESLTTVAGELIEPLGQAIAEAQALWFSTPIARYLDRAEGPVYLDNSEGRVTGRVSGSCYHDLALGVAVGLLRWIEAAVPASDYVSLMRFETAAGNLVGQHLAGLKPEVRCESRNGIARLRADSMPALRASAFTPEKLDPSCCPGCKTPVPEEYNTLPKVPCLVCGRWELQTGLGVMPVAAAAGKSPRVVRMFSPYWQALLPARHSDEGKKDPEKKRQGNPSVSPSAPRDELIRQMQPAVRIAYLAFCFAESKAGRRLEDREAYNLFREEGISGAEGDQGELADYTLPDVDTWVRYLGKARKILGEQKYTRRTGRPYGKSVAKSDEIENQKDDSE
jgi:hypothetical protein